MISQKFRKPFFWMIIVLCLLIGVGQIIASSIDSNASNLIINEFVAANGTGLTDEYGDFSDWIEIYNRSDQPINLSGWSLTDDSEQPDKWPLPDRTLGGNEYLVIFASGKNRLASELGTVLHTNFRLNKAGEFLGLHNVLEDRFMDAISPQFLTQFRDVSYGRYENGLVFGYLAQPTPGGPNDETLVWAGVVSPVKFSVERGFYDAPFTLILTNDTDGTTIRYTTDGSEPTETNGKSYNTPILIENTMIVRAAAFKPDFLPSYVDTHTYIFLDDVLTQPPDPPGFPSTWGTHSGNFMEYTKGTPVVADYAVDPEIVNDPRYKNSIKDDLKSIPTLSIVTAAPNFQLYAYPRRKGPNWERPVSVELIYPDGDEKRFQINSGIRIQGGAGRWEFMPKHSFRLFFRGKYGASKLTYPLFPDSPVETFNTLVLRGGVDRSYAGHPERNDHNLTTYTRDEWLRASQIAMSGIGSHGIFVQLYLNGLYWGLYNVVERPDDSFMSSYFGGREEEWLVANHSGILSGSSDSFKTLINLAQAGGLADPEKYAAIKTYIDTTQFIDYLILNWYAGNRDWPHNNWYVSMRNPSSKARYFVWDGEDIWNNGATIRLGSMNVLGLQNTVKPLVEALIQNPDFKMEFADRMYTHLFHNGALTDANAQARWLQINSQIDRAIVGESARWGDARFEQPITRDDWLKAQDDVLAQMEGNAAKLITLAREAGYYPPIDPPLFSQEGGLIEAGFVLTMTLPVASCEDCTIYYTTDGSDPRTSTTAMMNYSPLVLTDTTYLKARVLAGAPSTLFAATGQVWSALHEATFRVVEQDSKLRITEIMYNPADGDDYEFIELKNFGNGALNLANASLVEGIRYTFPPNTPLLAPGEFVILVSNPETFAERYPNVAISDTYDGRLSNKGEKITLVDAEGQIVVQVEYDDENGWAISPDGRGDSLVLINPDEDPNSPKNWRASANLNGSPGTDEPAAVNILSSIGGQ